MRVVIYDNDPWSLSFGTSIKQIVYQLEPQEDLKGYVEPVRKHHEKGRD